MHQFAWRFILRFGKRFSAGIERKSHFKEFHCDYMNQRRACVTGETAGLDVRKCIKGSQSKNDSSNTGSLPTHMLTDPTNTTSFKDTTNTHIKALVKSTLMSRKWGQILLSRPGYKTQSPHSRLGLASSFQQMKDCVPHESFHFLPLTEFQFISLGA